MNQTAPTIDMIDVFSSQDLNSESLENRSINDPPQRCPWDDWHPISDVPVSMAN